MLTFIKNFGYSKKNQKAAFSFVREIFTNEIIDLLGLHMRTSARVIPRLRELAIAPIALGRYGE